MFKLIPWCWTNFLAFIPSNTLLHVTCVNLFFITKYTQTYVDIYLEVIPFCEFLHGTSNNADFLKYCQSKVQIKWTGVAK